ncbi:MAG: DUF6339 family protein [Rhodoluna sp.]|nr:DUF6339 family protein [Rhodoluna sp.]
MTTKYARQIPEKIQAERRLEELVASGYEHKDSSEESNSAFKVAYEYYQPSELNSRLTDDDYANMRAAILKLASSCQGKLVFDPKSAATEKQATAFDRGLSTDGLEIFPLGLYESSRDEVWNYITLYVAPDVANWRYPNTGNNPKYDRHLGGYRNVFRQPWARGYFCSWDDALISELTEDIAVAIFERVNVASNPRVAVACLKATYKIRLKDKNNKIYRDALKRVVRIMSVRSLDQLPESSLQELIDDLFDQSYKHFAKAK